MKRLPIVAVLLLCGASMLMGGQPSHAAVTWQFNYINPGPTIGFFHKTLGRERRQALENLATEWGQKFDHTATIVMNVESEENASSSTLASAYSNNSTSGSSYNPGFGNFGVVRNKVLFGNDLNGGDVDGGVSVNWGQPWDLDDDVATDAFDFKSTMNHELCHVFGFAAYVGQDGQGVDDTIPLGAPNAWNQMDEFLADATGSLINSAYEMDIARWNAAKISETGLFFNGANAMAANADNPVVLYAPGTWEDGSSGGSHVNDASMLMFASTGMGPSARDLSAVEIGIFKDLGYTVVPLPSAILLLGPGLVGLGIIKRRSKT